MDKFIATKPVRFDRDYAVGEEVPNEVINPRAIKRMIDGGRIQRVVVPDEPESDTQQDVALEKSLAFVEELLGINYDAEPPLTLEERAEVIKVTVEELRTLRRDDINDGNDTQSDTSEQGSHPDDNQDDQHTSTSETSQDAEPPLTNAQTVSLTQSTATEDELSEDGADLPDMACSVCGRVMGSKGALTTHIRKEHPEIEM